MNRSIFLLLLVLITALAGFASVWAQQETDEAEAPYTVSEEMIGILSANLDNIFPLNSLKNNFMAPAEALYSDVGPDTMVRTETENGKRKLLLLANADGIHDHSFFEAVDKSYPSDFQLTMDVTVTDVFPAGQGGCYIGFTNNGVSAFSAAEGGVTISLLIDGLTAELYIKDAEADAGTHIPLGELVRQSSKLSIIHLTGHTYVYINGRYMGQYHDGRKGGFRLIYGPAVFTEGDSADCSFDNLLIRKVSVQ